jgi:SH3-like domain-containing protein
MGLLIISFDKEDFVKLILSTFLICLVLVESPPASAAKSIGKDEVNVRSGPSLKNSILYKAPLGYPIRIEKENGRWAYFRDWVDNRGWVHKDLVSNVRTAVVSVKKVNVRSGPGTRNRVVAEAGEGEIYKILRRKGDWIQIGYYHGGESLGWVRRDLVFGD